jgi:hypothetical protein
MLLVHHAASLTVEKISLEELTAQSDLIVRGIVVSSSSQWEQSSIYTYTTIRVEELLKGNPPADLRVKQLGGRVGEIAAEVPGTPELNPKDEVVLFLREWNGDYWIHSIALGKFTVLRDGPTAMTVSDLNNVGLVDPVTKQEITDKAGKINTIPLESFLNDVRSLSRN